MIAARRTFRRVLGELDPNRELNTPRGMSKRSPIGWDRENEDTILQGLSLGTYDFQEVIDYTAWQDGWAYTPSVLEQDAGEMGDADQQEPPAAARYANGEDGEEDGETYDTEGDEVGGGDDGFERSHPMDEDLDGQRMRDYVEDMGEDSENVETNAEEDGDDDASFEPAAHGLKEINNLAHFGVSSHKPGNGVKELLSDDLDKYWQSDGQQPHVLTIHFLRRVEIRAIRFFVDYHQDESYTPTHIVFVAGTGTHDLIQFADVRLKQPTGWQVVPISGAGGGPDGRSLCCWMVQMHVRENHQNGKDTHIRAIKIYAQDDHAGTATSASAKLSRDVEKVDLNFEPELREVDEMERISDSALPHELDEELQEMLETMDLIHGNSSKFSGAPAYMREPEIR